VIVRNDHPTGNPLLGAGAVHHIMSRRERVQQKRRLPAQISGYGY